MPRTGWIVFALAAGLGCGIIARQAGAEGLAVAAALKPFGQLWLNALRMTLVPLVFCLMTTGVAALVTRAGAGRMVGLALGTFVVLLLAAAVAGTLVTLGLMSLWPVQTMGATPPVETAATPGFAEQLLALIPINPIAAAAEAAMAPLIAFAALFGAAAARLPEADRTPLLAAIKGGGDALLVIVGWALKAAPAGVFLLALDAAASFGLTAAAGMVQYVLMLSAVLAVGLVCALAMGMAGAGPARFLKAASGPAALAASTQSSMASLPALITAARDDLGLPPALVGSLMPLAVTVFRFGNVFGAVGAGLIGAALFGVHPTAPQIVLAILVCVLTNIGVMGLPGAAVLLAAYGPVFNALGAPIEALTLLVAVFTLPDILDTSCNVTADLAVVSVVARLSGQDADTAQGEVIPA